MKGNCNKCQKDFDGAWCNIGKIDYTAELRDNEVYFTINSEQTVGKFCKDCYPLVKDNYNNHLFTLRVIDKTTLQSLSICPWCKEKSAGYMYLTECKDMLEHYMVCDKKKHLPPPAKIEEKSIKEQIYCANCGWKKNKVDNLSRKCEKCGSSEVRIIFVPKKNYWPLIIGGGLVVAGIGLVAYFCLRKKNADT